MLLIFLVLFNVLSFYFTLNFIENLHKGNDRIAKQSKNVAIACFTIAMILVSTLLFKTFY